MEARHTPGPWRTNGHTIEIRQMGLRVATVCPARAGSFAPRTALEATANTRLIAAAPELLEALIKIVRYADSEPDGGEKVEMHRANIERARAAIAKATGT